ncbi:hypothetical protein FNV43_RR02175 [Rhamnella rubrinervis]|uniref:non-specific serine/threonine protein kinase n=1 Tax=Rhamnella rubrinervis TaxID=2594499 RepID=A0A8K0HR01_9ROSA|nr:hypothetical protein FNV43_RR02175 [Rhamnella rubrinervis]
MNMVVEEPKEEPTETFLATRNHDGKKMHQETVKVMRTFDSKYCIGVGEYGTAYKALLSTDQVVAVNKFHENDEPASPEAFTGEINALTAAQHQISLSTKDFVHMQDTHFRCMDISSNNVFMDAHEAHIAEFGSASILVPESSSSWSSFAGTLGYSVPDLAYDVGANEKCDMYSFGVVALEVIVGKYPGDLISSL